ncbi:MAG: ABC transporter substrate-binding protein [Pseudomonadota bacterium]
MPIAAIIVRWGLPKVMGVLAALTLLAGCAPGDQPFANEAGTARFVSLNPCLDAILLEVADADQVLAISHYSHQPGGSSIGLEMASRFASTSGTAEEIIALEPDIVLASVFLPLATKAALERAGLRIESFASPGTVDESAAQIDRMADLAGRPEAGSQLIRTMQKSLWASALKAGRDESENPTVLLWQAGQIVAGQETLISQILEQEGFDSHSAALGLKQADYVSLEQVLADPPDLLLIAGESAGQQHPALDHLKGMRVQFFDPNLFYCGGPSISKARAELHALRRSFEDGPQ